VVDARWRARLLVALQHTSLRTPAADDFEDLASSTHLLLSLRHCILNRLSILLAVVPTATRL
jgi:hypothetical protein